jgi:voltage-gated potassium channel
MLSRIRARTAEILDVPTPGDHVSRAVDVFIIVLILVNVVAVILESVASLRLRWGDAFRLLEQISLIVFSLEYLLRVWSIVDNRWRAEYRHPLWGRLRFMRSPLALIDLLAVLPFWLSMFVPLDLRFLRVARLLRVLKLTRYSAATNLLFEVLRDEARVIGAAMFTLFLMLVLTASATWLVEHEAQPEVFANIPQAMWWAIITVTTVGYGDIVPITPLGKVLGSVLGFIGVGMVALPAGILASGFSDVINRRRNDLRRQRNRAMADGRVDAEERRILQAHGQSLSLSEDEVDEILDETSPTAPRAGGHATCPHCGGSLGPERGSH